MKPHTVKRAGGRMYKTESLVLPTFVHFRGTCQTVLYGFDHPETREHQNAEHSKGCQRNQSELAVLAPESLALRCHYGYGCYNGYAEKESSHIPVEAPLPKMFPVQQRIFIYGIPIEIHHVRLLESALQTSKS